MAGAGLLSLVSTPIGNLSDLTFRAVEVLKNADLIACEDTRHSKVLLDHYGIRKPLVSYHDFSEKRRVPELLSKIEAGQRVALISDAGTPGIADPGFRLVREAIDRGLHVEGIPGPTAFVTALVLSGLPTHRFAFEGFFPIKDGARRRLLTELKDDPRTLIFYESPHRLLKTLTAIEETIGDIPIVVARELTKKFEEVLRAPVSEVRKRFSGQKVLGEFVVLWNRNARP